MINSANLDLLADVLNEHAIVSIADSLGNIIYVNNKFIEISGYSLSELLGKNHRLLKSGIHSAKFYQEMWDKLLDGKVWHGEVCNRRKNGSLYWVHATIKPILDGNGLPIQYISIRTDITEAKQAELVSRSSQTLLLNVINAIPDLIFFKDQDGKFLGCNHAFEQYYGAKEHEIIGKTDFDFVDYDTATFFREMDAKMLAAKKPQLNEEVLVYPDGKVVEVETLKIPYPYAENSLGVIGIAHDITERKQQLQALQEAEARFSFAVEGAGDGIWDWDLRTGKMLLSGNYEPMLGFNKGEIEPTIDAWVNSVHPDDLLEIQQTLQGYLTGKLSLYVVQLRLRCKNKNYLWVLCRGTVVARDDQGNPTRMIGIHSDISERKSTEQALVAARIEAERANKAKSDFLSNMSHELRTPMNAILGFAQMLECDAELNEDQQDNVYEILKGGRHLLELINEVLDLSKIEAGYVDISLEPIDVSSVVNECISMVEPLMMQRRITLHLGVPLHTVVRADRVRFKQALLNLLSNAVKYNRDGGHIYLDVQFATGQRLRITVTDTGGGIALDRISELFQPFQRLGAEHSGIEGHGIGLTITRRLVELMGGEVGVDSQVGVGSTFWIELPREVMADAEVDVQDVGGVAVSQVGQYRILCVDDNPVNLKLVTQILGLRQHVHLITAHKPELAISLALTHQPDLILLDINMPHMDGYQVLNVLKSYATLKDIPVIAVTANAMPRDVERGRAAGFCGYITKPLNLAVFLETIDNCLSSKIGTNNG